MPYHTLPAAGDQRPERHQTGSSRDGETLEQLEHSGALCGTRRREQADKYQTWSISPVCLTPYLLGTIVTCYRARPPWLLVMQPLLEPIGLRIRLLLSFLLFPRTSQ